MKYLVIGKPGPMPPPVELVRSAQGWLQARLDDGTFECVYAYPEGGGLSIGEYESAEQLMEELIDYPLSPFVDYEVHSLVDMDAGFERLIPFIEKMSAQLAAQGA
jgi:hypothetical protein